MKKPKIAALTLALFLCFSVNAATAEAFDLLDSEQVYLGGQPFGVKLHTDGVIVIGINDIESFGGTVCPAEEAGIKVGDIIKAADGNTISDAEALREAVESCTDGITLTVLRNSETLEITLYPALSKADNKYRAGLWLRDSTAGIGTVTYVKADGSFGGLGHGIVDSESGTLLPLGNGSVVDVEINSVTKGKRGAPGELRGSFGNIEVGTLDKNTVSGVYGMLDRLPESDMIPVSNEVKLGKAYIFTTVEGTKPDMYEIEIKKLYKSSDTKNMLIKVTDKRLLEISGGIVQGMSGSPIVQNNKLVGAVTHVLVNDPTQGYGIFIGNMMEQS